MSIVLTPEQHDLLQRGEPVQVRNPDTGEDVVLLQGVDYDTIRQLLEEERTRRSVARVALQSAAAWAQENPDRGTIAC